MIANSTSGVQILADYRHLREAVRAHALQTDISKGHGSITTAAPDSVSIAVLQGGDGGVSTITYTEKRIGGKHVVDEEARTTSAPDRTDETVVRKRVDDSGALIGMWIDGREQPIGNIAGAAPPNEGPPRLNPRQVLSHYDAICAKLAAPAPRAPNAFLLEGEEDDRMRFSAGEGGIGWPGMTRIQVTDPNPEHLRTRESDGAGVSVPTDYAYDVEHNGGPYKTLVCTTTRPPAPWLYGPDDKGETQVHRIDMGTGEFAP